MNKEIESINNIIECCFDFKQGWGECKLDLVALAEKDVGLVDKIEERLKQKDALTRNSEGGENNGK